MTSTHAAAYQLSKLLNSSTSRTSLPSRIFFFFRLLDVEIHLRQFDRTSSINTNRYPIWISNNSNVNQMKASKKIEEIQEFLPDP